MTDDAPVQPLRGLVVLDLGKVWIGPTVAHLLSDFGARVIEVRSRAVDVLDEDRFGNFIPLAYDRSVREYTDISRNRESITLNFLRPAAIELFKRLLPHVDVLVENFAVRVMRNFNLEYETIRAINPRLIMMSMSAAGQTGPWRDALTYAPSLTALYGGKSLIGYPDNQRVLKDASEMDPMNGIYAVIALCVALRQRQRTGEGAYIDLAQGEAMVQGIAETTLDYVMNGRTATVAGNRHHLMAPHSYFPQPGIRRSRSRWRRTRSGDRCARSSASRSGRNEPGVRGFTGRHQHEPTINQAIAAFTRDQDAEAVTLTLQDGRRRGVPGA